MNATASSIGSAADHPNAAGSRLARSWVGRSVAGAGLALILAACGASASATPSATGVPTGTVAAGAGAAAAPTSIAGNSNRAAGQAYRTCLTQNGVTLPTRPTQPPNATTPTNNGNGGGVGGGGFGGGGGLQAVIADPANAAAVAACKSLQPVAGVGNGGNVGNRGQASQAYFSCLSDNGVTVPTTVAGGPPPSIDRTTPAFTAANAKCQALLPNRGSNSPTTTTTVAGA
jgi:hypothetical protein